MYKIRRARNGDIPEIIELWRLTRPHDTIKQKSVERFFDDPTCYRSDTVLVAQADAVIIGFIVGVVDNRRRQGRIPVFFVHPNYLGCDTPDDLLNHVLDVFRAEGLALAEAGTSWGTGLSDCGYDSRYVDILDVFSRNGFERVWTDDELDVDIVRSLKDFSIPPWVLRIREKLEQVGIFFGFCEPEFRTKYLRFMKQHFRNYISWCERAEQYVESSDDPRLRVLAFRGNEIVGFTECRYEDGWHIDATGVREDLRRQGIGTVLVYLAMEEMKRQGAERMYVGECPYDFYKVIAGQVLRHYMVMRKTLNAETSNCVERMQ